MHTYLLTSFRSFIFSPRIAHFTWWYPIEEDIWWIYILNSEIIGFGFNEKRYIVIVLVKNQYSPK